MLDMFEGTVRVFIKYCIVLFGLYYPHKLNSDKNLHLYQKQDAIFSN